MEQWTGPRLQHKVPRTSTSTLMFQSCEKKSIDNYVARGLLRQLPCFDIFPGI